ncbi:MAG: hypothetical protein NTY76_05260 [Candidatus Omnitrophica bacterium]|nr:hypothetical protein [Candidatus Omnitrophota bacterium]
MKRKKHAVQKTVDESMSGIRPGPWYNADRYQFTAFIIACALFCYTCFRAGVISISHDEALTYLIHAQGSIRNIFLHAGAISSNNHLLNTLFIKFFCEVLGNNEFVIRIPALIGHILYLVASLKILDLFFKKAKYLLGFLLLTTNPFLLDFFSCARGYALGVGFLMFGLYFFLKRNYACDSLRPRCNILTLSMLGFSVLSNLAFANVLFAIMALIGISEIYEMIRAAKNSMVKAFKTLAMGFLIPAACILIVLRFIYSAPVMDRIKLFITDYGGTTGFWANTVTTVLECVLYGKSYAGPEALHVIKIIIFMLYVIALIVAISIGINGRPGNKNNTNTLWLAMLLLLIIVSMNIQFTFFHIKYAIDRAAIYLVPLYLVLVISFWSSLSSSAHSAWRAIMNGFFFVIISAAVLHGILCMNITHFHIWKYDADTKNVMRKIYDLTKNNIPGGNKYRIGINWLFEPATNYYIIKDKTYWIDFTTRQGPDGIYDFYYLLEPDKEIIKKYDLRVLRSSDISNAILASRNGI